MKSPKAEKINLPYASNVASFFGDQGNSQGKSFLGKMFAGANRTVVSRNFSPPAAAASAPRGSGLYSGVSK